MHTISAPMFQAILQDLRYAWRSLLAHPAFSLIAAGSLALGVSTAAGVFTVLDGAYGKGIPFPNADRLVVLYAGPDPDNGTFDLPGAELEQVVNGSTLLASVAPYRITYPTVHAKDWATRLSMVEVTQAFTSAIGIRVIAGRGFTTRDEQPDAPGVAIISYSLWATRFGASQDALGQSLEIDGRVHEIVGVVNRETAFPDYASLLWTARPLRALLSDTSRHGLYGLALLKPGVTPAQGERCRRSRRHGAKCRFAGSRNGQLWHQGHW